MKFGEVYNRRESADGYLRITPTVDVNANAIYWPSTSYALFGVAEHPVKANHLGNLATTGVFWFPAPSAATFTVGQKVPVTVTAKIASVVSAHASGDPALFVGRCVEAKTSGSTQVKVLLERFALSTE